MLIDTAKHRQRPHPHDFWQSLAQWEEAVFVAADHFVLSRRTGIGEYEQVELASWPEVKAGGARTRAGQIS
jgi:hypothetical protein